MALVKAVSDSQLFPCLSTKANSRCPRLRGGSPALWRGSLAQLCPNFTHKCAADALLQEGGAVRPAGWW